MGEGPEFHLDCALSVTAGDHEFEAFGYLKIQIGISSILVVGKVLGTGEVIERPLEVL